MKDTARLISASATYSRARVDGAARLLLWPVALLALIAIILSLGVWKKEHAFAGPFAAEGGLARPALILTIADQSHGAWWRQPLAGDTIEKPHESTLGLQINGREIRPPHSPHELIRQGKTTGFSHWHDYVYFSLPPGVQNDAATIATIRYSVRPRHWITVILMAWTLGLVWCVHDHPLKSFARRYRVGLQTFALKTPYLILTGLCLIGATGSAIYLVSSVYALAKGWALPTVALVEWTSIAKWFALNEPYLGYLILTLASFGTLMTWLAGNASLRDQTVNLEQRSRRVLAWCAFPIVACAFVLCLSSMWVGLIRQGDLHSASISGLVPFNDAHGHLFAAYDQARGGTWTEFAQRRPLATAFRTVLLFLSNYSAPTVLLLQIFLMAAAACFAAHRIALWRGVWAATGFLGLFYIYARIFAPTMLTEPLGIFWAVLSIPFFIEAFRTRSLQPALIAFAMTSAALMTRMGSMFTIPALLVWLVWQFGSSLAARCRIGVVSMTVLLGVFGMNALLQKAYGTTGGTTGSNFAYVACGLSIGTDWQGCPEKFAAEGEPLQGSEATTANRLYSQAWKNFRAQPDVLLGRLADTVSAFATQFRDVIWRGYGGGAAVVEPDWLYRSPITWLSLAGLLFVAVSRANAVELGFWALFWTSLFASASIVYFDDGARTLAASQPMIALFFAMGFTNPALVSGTGSPRPQLSRYGWLGLAAAAAFFISIPWIVHRTFPANLLGLVTKPDESFVLGGRRISGVLVVEDGAARRHDIPTLHLADFEAIIDQSGVERYQGLLHPVRPPLPFGFVFAPPVEAKVKGSIFIVPPEVLERHDVAVWRFEIKPWDHKPGGPGRYWTYVTKAQPFNPEGRR